MPARCANTPTTHTCVQEIPGVLQHRHDRYACSSKYFPQPSLAIPGMSNRAHSVPGMQNISPRKYIYCCRGLFWHQPWSRERPELARGVEFSPPLALSAVLHPSANCDETFLSVRNCSLQQLLSCIWLTEASDGLRPFAVFASTTRPCPRIA